MPPEGTHSAEGYVALVFGREFEGLTDAELAQCDATCSIPLGRLQESLSLSHCVSVALSEVFQYRWQFLPDECKRLYSVGATDVLSLSAGSDTSVR